MNTTSFLYSILLAILFSCQRESSPEAGLVWKIYLEGIGTFSSVRIADLNRDGIPDIIMGTGGKENMSCDTAVIAVDGAIGQLLWRARGNNQFVGSAVFQDITEDNIPDVFIGGRWAELLALDGADGSILWQFLPKRTHPNPADSGWYNFSTPQFIPDQDGDELPDILISNGGDPTVPPHDPNRPPGRLLVLSSRSGKILADARVPDGKETYMSVVCQEKKGNVFVIFGTGGETIGGSLFRTTLNEVMNGNISQSKILATDTAKGFIAPPVLADITMDGIEDIIINAVDGRILAIDGNTDSLLWEVSFPGTEAYSTPAVGFFNPDPVPDFFTNYGVGTFPELPQSILFAVNGKTGEVMYEVTVNDYQYASPVAADLNGDGFDEVIVNKGEINEQKDPDLYSYLLVFDFIRDRQFIIGDTLTGVNHASTPWIGDLDGNGYLDIIYNSVAYEITPEEEIPRGLYLARYKTGYLLKTPVTWGAYMGSDYTGVFSSTK